jgi:hypothetical protein
MLQNGEVWCEANGQMSSPSTCPVCRVAAAPQLLARAGEHMDTLLTYHRTWETGVGCGYEGHRIQPFKSF